MSAMRSWPLRRADTSSHQVEWPDGRSISPHDSHPMSPEGVALQTRLRSRVVRLLNWTRPEKGGTAVKIQLADRFFLATAAHVFRDGDDIRALVPGEPDHFVSSFVNRLRDSSKDVALLEVKQEDAKSLGAAFVSPDEILPQFDQSPSPVIVVGYPVKFVHSVDRQNLANASARLHDFSTIYFVTETLPISEWPKRIARPPTSDADVFASFEPSLDLQRLKLNDLSVPPQDVKLPEVDLSGVSGGGIWLEIPPPRETTIWQPHAQLIALDITIGDKWLRGTLISNWLDLVRQHYPDLAKLIDSFHPPREG